MTAKEILQFENTARRTHEFLGGNPRNGGFMQIQHVGDFTKYHRTHRNCSMLEKLLLAFNNGCRCLEDGVETLLYVLYQPFCFVQLTGQPTGRVIMVSFQNLGIEPVDPETRHSFRVKAGYPGTAD